MIEQGRQRGGSKGHHRADGQIDAAGRHDDRHAESDDHDRCDLHQLQTQVRQRGEVGREHDVEGDEQPERGVDAVRAQAEM